MRLRLALVWATYMLGLGTFFPYFSLYLGETLGLPAGRVGLVVGVMPLAGVLTLPFWGHLADRTGSRRASLAVAAAGMGALQLVLGRLESTAALVVGAAALAVFSTAVLPLLTAASMALLDTRAAHGFGAVRLWGTVGFLVAVVTFPRVLAHWGDAGLAGYRGLGLIFPVTALACCAAAVAALALPRLPSLELRAAPGEARGILAHLPVRRLLLVVFAAHCLMQGPIHLFPLFLAARGGDASTVGRMWVAMLVLEIPLVALSGWTLAGVGARGLLTAGLAAEAVRWTTCALAPGLGPVFAVQLLHGVGVAGVFVGAQLYLEQAVSPPLRATGQSLVSTAGFGAGAILSITVAGWLLEHVSPVAPYALAGAGAGVLALAVHRVLPPPTPPAPPA